MIPRRTLSAPAAVQGRGLFTGKPASLFILPADAGTGLMLRRADKPGASVLATAAYLAQQPAGIPARNTTLASSGGVRFFTTEHILSALTGLGITDAVLELDGAEVPIGDGSAAFLCDALLRAGLRDLDDSIEPIRISSPITVESRDAKVTARPRAAAGCSYTYELDFGPSSPIPAQRATWSAIPPTQDPGLGTQGLSPSARDYLSDLAPARTFCLQSEAEQMRAAGLFKDFAPADLLVIGDRGPIDNSYRFENEPARHKLLDLIGDLALAGRPIQADITATRAGHMLNHQLARALLAAASHPA